MKNSLQIKIRKNPVLYLEYSMNINLMNKMLMNVREM